MSAVGVAIRLPFHKHASTRAHAGTHAPQHAVVGLERRARAADLVEAGVSLGADDQELPVLAIASVHEHRVDVVPVPSPHFRPATCPAGGDG